MNMKFSQVKHHILGALEQLLGFQVHEVSEAVPSGSTDMDNADWIPDLQLCADNTPFLIEYKAQASSEAVGAAIQHIRAFKAESEKENVLPLLVVPFMWNVGRRLCQEAGISWMDLSGNAWIWEGGFRVSVLGRPNAYKQKGSPTNLFAPKSSRVVRILLESFPQPILQKELPELTGLGKGYISRILSRLADGFFIEKDKNGAISVSEPNLLFDAWREAYEFEKHSVRKGHLAGKTSQGILQSLSRALAQRQILHAATGLASAWLYTHFAGFRVSTVYLSDFLPDQEWNEIGIRWEERGSNIWLVQPDDEAVFQGRTEIDRIPCVSPLQTYLDLKSHPERAEEAAEEIRNRLLVWSLR